MASVSSPPLRVYDTPDQTITSGGQLVIPHNLPKKPIFAEYFLKNLVAEHGYSVGDEVQVSPSYQYIGADGGFSSVRDGTNFTIRFGTYAAVFGINNKTTGAVAYATNAKWAFIIRYA